MAETFAWDLIAASSLLLGGLLVLGFSIRRHALGFVMASGAGVLFPQMSVACLWVWVRPQEERARAHARLALRSPAARWDALRRLARPALPPQSRGWALCSG